MRRLLLIAVSAVLAAFVVAPAANAAPSSNSDLRVIVELAIPADSTAEQITAAGDELLAQLPAGSYAVTNRYTLIPFIGLTVAPTAMQALQTSPLVVAVHNDGAVNASPGKPVTTNPTLVGKPAVKGKSASKKCKRGKSKSAKKKYKRCIAAQKKAKQK